MVKFRIYFRRICSEFPECVGELDLGSEVKQELEWVLGLDLNSWVYGGAIYQDRKDCM